MFCTYITFYKGNKLPPFYIGYTSVKRIEEKNYNGTVESVEYKKIWNSERRKNPFLFKTKILTRHSTREEASTKETYFLNFFDAKSNPMFINKHNGKNGNGFLGFEGRKHSEETKQRMRENRLGKLASQDTKDKMSLVRKGKPKTEEHRKNISIGKSGTPASEEHKARLLSYVKGKKQSSNHVEQRASKIARTYRVLCPNGEIIVVNNLSKFCNANKLNRGSIQRPRGYGGYKILGKIENGGN